MLRRDLGIVCLFAISVLSLTGCESWRQALRHNGDDQAKAEKKDKANSEVMAVESDPSRISAVDSDAKSPQPFFKNNRKSGAWSSEAREIESHLGVQ
jgi:hypothetical protein